MRNLPTGFLLIFAGLFACGEVHAMKWQDYRQSKNVIDVRAETKAVNTQANLEAGRRYLVATMLMAEKDATEHPECATLALEIEKLKAARAELEALGEEPVRRLTCAAEDTGSGVNLCAKIRAEDPASAPAMPNLKKFEEELTFNFGPVMEQLGRIQAGIEAKGAAMAKEDIKCRATLQLIERKAAEVRESYVSLQQMILDLHKLNQ